MATVELPLYASHTDVKCTRCPLEGTAKTVCMPTVKFGNAGPAFVRTKPRAVLIVGKAPVFIEDREGKPFIGPSGHMLRSCYIDFFDLSEKVDVYLTNALRCRLPQDSDDPKKTELQACQGFNLRDIQTLQSMYDEVILLAVGGAGLKSITGSALTGKKGWLSRQGHTTDFTQLCSTKKSVEGRTSALGWEKLPEPCRVFATYHPAYIRKNPSIGLAVHSHIGRLVDYLEGRKHVEISGHLDIAVAPVPVPYSIKRLALDIETYGFYKDGPAQTMFHPAKMVAYDGVSRDRIVRIVTLTWRNLSGEVHHAVFNMEKGVHRRRLWSWIRKVRKDPKFEFLVGHNINFDLVCLRYCFPECRPWLDYPLPIMDTIITNSLHDENKPEKSLKNLSPLLGITEYEVDGEVKRYENADDPTGHQYGCQDTFATLRLQEKLEEEIRAFYGEDTQKLSPYCFQWYSELLWLLIWMTETGVKMDQHRLERLFHGVKVRHDAFVDEAWDKWTMPLRGKGSLTALQDMMRDSFDLFKPLDVESPPCELTKTGLLPTDKETRNSLVEALDKITFTEPPEPLQKLKLLDDYKKNAKIRDSYLFPLLVGRGKDHADRSTRLVDGTAFPKWFPVPSEYEDGKTGGTKQSRFACSGPSVPTFPPGIKRCVTGRFRPGYFIWSDYSQIELRAAALLSNDKVMVEEYSGKPDLHTRTARIIFGEDFVSDYLDKKGLKAWKEDKYRQAGKTTNFLMLFLGGAQTLHESLMRDVSVNIPVRRCQEIIDEFWDLYKGLKKWQNSVIEFVKENEYFEIPLIGNSRLFLGGKKAREAAVSEIVNIPIQAVAAVINQSAQFHLWAECRRRKLRAVVPINIYDAVSIECPRTEKYAVDSAMAKILPCPPYYRDLCDHLGRTLPLEYETKEKYLEA